MKKVSIHILKLGITQVIEDGLVFKAKNSDLTKLNDLIDALKLLKPENVNDEEYHVINIIEPIRFIYIAGKKNGNFHGNFSDINKSKIDALVAEVKSFS
jgi:hypothetical protein